MSALTLAFDDSESPKKPTAAFVHVTPEIAARWLRQNTRNRTIRQHLVDRFTRDMQAGEWHLDGAPIRFAPDGTLLDGQHRLTAIVSTGITVPILVVRGIDPSAQAVMDTGAARTAADALSIDGRENASTLAATAALAIRAETDRLDTTGQKGIVSHSEILRWIDENPDAPAACEFARKYSRKTDATPSLVAYTYLILSRLDAGRDAGPDRLGGGGGDGEPGTDDRPGAVADRLLGKDRGFLPVDVEHLAQEHLCRVGLLASPRLDHLTALDHRPRVRGQCLLRHLLSERPTSRPRLRRVGGLAEPRPERLAERLPLLDRPPGRRPHHQRIVGAG